MNDSLEIIVVILVFVLVYFGKLGLHALLSRFSSDKKNNDDKNRH